MDGLEAWHAKAEGNCAIDYGFHMILGGVDDDSLDDDGHLVEREGITSFKLFMAYPGVFYSDDGKILRAMQKASANGSMIMMHAENGIAIDVLVAAGAGPGRDRPGQPRPDPPGADWRTRPPTGRSSWPRSPAPRSTSCTCRPARPSSGGRGPRRRRQRVRRDLPAVPVPDARGPPRGARASRAPSTSARRRCAPSTSTTSEDLWRGLRTNDLPVVSTDHCPFCFKEQKELGLGDFSKIPNGIGGVEHRMDLLYQGVVDGRAHAAPLGRDGLRPRPARMFGLYPRKGVIAPGSDADIVVYDPHGHHRDQRRDPPHEHRLLGLRGHEIDGQGRHRAVAGAGSWSTATSTTGAKGHGKYLRRGLSQYLV